MYIKWGRSGQVARAIQIRAAMAKWGRSGLVGHEGVRCSACGWPFSLPQASQVLSREFQTHAILDKRFRTFLPLQPLPYPRWLDCSPPTIANRDRFPAGLLPDFNKWESCRTTSMVGEVFSGFSPPLHSGTAQYSPRFTLIGSQISMIKEPFIPLRSLTQAPTNSPNDPRNAQLQRVITKPPLLSPRQSLSTSPCGNSSSTSLPPDICTDSPRGGHQSALYKDCASYTTRLPLKRTGFDSRWGRSWISVCGNRAQTMFVGRRVFSGIFRFPHSCVREQLHTQLASPSSAPKTSMLRAAQISAFTYNFTLLRRRRINKEIRPIAKLNLHMVEGHIVHCLARSTFDTGIPIGLCCSDVKSRYKISRLVGDSLSTRAVSAQQTHPRAHTTGVVFFRCRVVKEESWIAVSERNCKDNNNCEPGLHEPRRPVC
ncbi:hypothetical protein PR048_031056 [Dryococelus australis]|uniref:Uncharacterized protein n=1 Tax=Dryococelus australis TaxID=614101 RepID=A0ABQ9G5D3_9NEOP|nr:hypothetical protein PR048_031056 [Dryococelus australis]